MQRIMGLARKAITEYNMIQDGDRVAVGVSGGKDSVALTLALQRLRRFIGIDYQVAAITLDPCFGGVECDYSPIAELFEQEGIEYVIKRTNIGRVVFDVREETNPCSLCAKMRRGALHDTAKELGCNKIALGHHYDDVIETILMGMLYGAQVQTMMPKLHSTNFEGMELIRPMYLIREEDIIHWANYNGLRFLRCACRFTEQCANKEETDKSSKRAEVKELIHTLAQKDPVIEFNIFKSVENVNLNTVVAYKKDGVKHHFLETYDEQ